MLYLIRCKNASERRVSEHASNHVWERVRPHLHYHKRLLRGHPLHFITHADNDISRRTGNHTYLSLIYGLKDWNKSPARVSLPSYPYPQSPLIPLNQGKSGRYVPFIRRLIACSITCSVFQISQTTSIMLMARRMSLRADRNRSASCCFWETPTDLHGWADVYCLVIANRSQCEHHYEEDVLVTESLNVI